ncbi:hypothetical protein E2C01_069927 [Portunus trituberculatus]|uniref:Uncharacterized protein n=1 Tax=Portunus trituberculatus TaxID=210409 RepID=A0A5B7I271_PORTR|nr:hypothetical protein [Portunus trituberculatus]
MLSSASVIRVGKPLWCLGTQEFCMVRAPSRTGSGSSLEARTCLEPRPRPLPLTW